MNLLARFGARLCQFIGTDALADEEFNHLALELFELQLEHNEAYRSLRRGRPEVTSWREIPAAPTAAFKELELTSILKAERTKEFRSSGTTGQKPSRHFHSAESLRVYEASLMPPLREHFLNGDIAPISLTPSTRDAPHSSLVHMFHMANPLFIGHADWTLSASVARVVLRHVGKAIALMGTAFNFVELCAAVSMQLPAGSRVLETGGYKGRSREVSRAELHGLIEDALGVSEIVTEYGMCELSSQAYAHDDGVFHFPPWARVQIISPENGREVREGEAGLIRVFDLANVWSVLAIQTEDLGVRRGPGFELLGRASGAEARGCSLTSR